MFRAPVVIAGIVIALFIGVMVLSVEAVFVPRSQTHVVEGGDAAVGRALIAEYGCGACHTVPGVPGADGRVGPYLGYFGGQSYIAGNLPNTPENLVRWITAPQRVEPGTAMPDLNVTGREARHIAAYLYSLE